MSALATGDPAVTRLKPPNSSAAAKALLAVWVAFMV
jgi:hypothetical protein